MPLTPPIQSPPSYRSAYPPPSPSPVYDQESRARLAESERQRAIAEQTAIELQRQLAALRGQRSAESEQIQAQYNAVKQAEYQRQQTEQQAQLQQQAQAQQQAQRDYEQQLRSNTRQSAADQRQRDNQARLTALAATDLPKLREAARLYTQLVQRATVQRNQTANTSTLRANVINGRGNFSGRIQTGLNEAKEAYELYRQLTSHELFSTYFYTEGRVFRDIPWADNDFVQSNPILGSLQFIRERSQPALR
jgi:hypothetical protein